MPFKASETTICGANLLAQRQTDGSCHMEENCPQRHSSQGVLWIIPRKQVSIKRLCCFQM